MCIKYCACNKIYSEKFESSNYHNLNHRTACMRWMHNLKPSTGKCLRGRASELHIIKIWETPQHPSVPPPYSSPLTTVLSWWTSTLATLCPTVRTGTTELSLTSQVRTYYVHEDKYYLFLSSSMPRILFCHAVVHFCQCCDWLRTVLASSDHTNTIFIFFFFFFVQITSTISVRSQVWTTYVGLGSDFCGIGRQALSLSLSLSQNWQ